MNYVLVAQSLDGHLSVENANRLTVGDTRSSEDLRAFQSAVRTLANDTAPDLVAIKEKPEKGAMMAGAAALKMEGIVLANMTCRVVFISGNRINRCSETAGSLKEYHKPAFKAAAVALAGK